MPSYHNRSATVFFSALLQLPVILYFLYWDSLTIFILPQHLPVDHKIRKNVRTLPSPGYFFRFLKIPYCSFLFPWHSLIFPHCSFLFPRYSLFFPRHSFLFSRYTFFFPRRSLLHPRHSFFAPRQSFFFPQHSFIYP